MKKKIRTCIIIIILLILFFTIPKGTLDDGGSKNWDWRNAKGSRQKSQYDSSADFDAEHAVSSASENKKPIDCIT